VQRLRFVLFGSIVAAAIASVYLILISPPDPGPVDRAAVKRIQTLCGARTDCEVTLRDIFSGDWDTFYEFGYDVSQHEVSKVLNTKTVWVSDLQNIYVFTKNGRIVKKGYGDSGQEQPLAGEIEFFGTTGKDLGTSRR
jgi:hypothetical protein